MTVARNFGQLVRISWLWLLIMLPVYAVLHWWIWPWTVDAGQQEGGLALAMTMLPNVIEIPALASIAVAWHRQVLRQEEMRGAFYLRLDRVVLWYALAALGFYLLAIGPFLYASTRVVAPPEPLDSLSAYWMPLLRIFVLVTAGLAIGFILMPRLSLVLPAIALGERLSLAGSWRATRGNTWRLAWASLLCTLPPIILFVPLLWYADYEARTPSVVAATISSLAYVLIITIAVTLLSLTYRHFVERQETGAETAA